MLRWTLLAGALVAALAAAMFLYVGHAMSRRRVAPADQLSLALYFTWWAGLAACAALEAFQNLLAVADARDLALFATVRFTTIVCMCIALWGFLYHVAYLYSGRRWIVWPISAYFLSAYSLLSYVMMTRGPMEVAVTTWSTHLVYARDSPLLVGANVALFGPAIAAGVAQAALVARIRDLSQRARLLLVSGCIVLLFSTVLLGSLLDGDAEAWLGLQRVVVGLIFLGGTLLAYRPPTWFRRWLARRGQANG